MSRRAEEIFLLTLFGSLIGALTSIIILEQNKASIDVLAFAVFVWLISSLLSAFYTHKFVAGRLYRIGIVCLGLCAPVFAAVFTIILGLYFVVEFAKKAGEVTK